jgi:hypothetical protein
MTSIFNIDNANLIVKLLKQMKAHCEIIKTDESTVI